MRIDAIKARKITNSVKNKTPLEETKPMIFLTKIFDKIQLMIIYIKVRHIAYNKDNVLSVRNLSQALQDKLEKDYKFLVTYHRFDECFYIRW